MKRQEFRELLEQSFAPFRNLPPAPVDAAWKRVLDRQRDDAATINDERPADFGPVEPVAGRRRIAYAAAGAAVFAAVLVYFGVVLNTGTRSEEIQLSATLPSKPPDTVAGTVLTLPDSSTIETKAGSEFSTERAVDGIRIRLVDGSAIVTAARQRQGHLYVQTKHLTVSVTGTVFLVSVEQAGSRVAVIEGEVNVEAGATSKRLRRGEQIATAPLLELRELREAISWSHNAQTYLALLQQRAAAPRQIERQNFEVASVKPVMPGAPQAGQRGRGSTRPPLLVQNNRILATNNLYQLINLAYGMKVRMRGPFSPGLDEPERILGGPSWLRSDQFEIEAVLPEGTPVYSLQQVFAGAAPKLQEMLQTLLEDRFKLVTHRETREMPTYNLVVAKSGKMRLAEDQSPPDLALKPGPIRAGDAPPRGGIFQWSTPSGEVLLGTAITMAQFAEILRGQVGRLVTDKTNLKGLYDVRVDFAPEDVPTADPGPSIFSALVNQLGLKLEPVRGPVEVLVVDRAERPSEN